MATSLQLAEGNTILMDAVNRSRKLLNRRALVGAVASAVPVAGLDWAVDAALLTQLVPAINAQFGLTPAQLDSLPAHKREQVQKALTMVGSVVIGKLVTRDLVMRMAQTVGKRLTAKQAAFHLGLSCSTLKAMRAAGKGPRCRLHGRTWRYHVDDLEAWSQAHARGAADG